MEYFKVGKIVATHGLDGRVIIQHSLGKNKGWEKTQTIFLEEKKDSFIPWFLTHINTSEKNGKLLVALDGVSTKEQAAHLLKKEVWVPEDDYNRMLSPESTISLLGFEIYDHEKLLGTVSEVVEQTAQTLARITVNSKEVWIPLHTDFIVKTDRKHKKLFMKLPDGLTDVYLE